jgi:trk system potassium uptake protein TrkA
VGSQLASLFSQDNNNNVVVIDSDPAAFNTLGRHFEGRTVAGLGYDEDVLTAAGIDDCEILVAVTDQDNSNLMIAEVARKLFGVPRVLTRLYNPDRENAYLQLGLDHVCGTTLVAEEMYSMLMTQHSGHIDTFGDFEILRFALNLDNIEQDSITAGEMERTFEMRVIALLRRGGQSSIIPTRETVIYHDDILLACIDKNHLDKISHIMSN